jgi:hypothetical protein
MTTKNGWAGTVRGMPRSGEVATRTKTMSKRDIELYTEITRRASR